MAPAMLENRSRPVGTNLPPDAILGPRATTLLDELAQDFPDRRPGGSDAGGDPLVLRQWR